MIINRRDLLRAAGALGILGLPRGLLDAADPPAAEGGDVLVVLQLSGGNDALNTVIPFRDPLYHRARPALAQREEQVLRLDGADLGLHPALAGLHRLHQDGSVAILPGVGYPDPDRSHFRSMDIWHTAEPERARVGTASLAGWLGARLDAGCAALHVGDGQLPLALAGPRPVTSFADPAVLDRLTTGDGVRARELLARIHERPRAGEAERLRLLARESLDRLERLLRIARDDAPDYPGSALGAHLRLTGRLIAGGFPSRVYYLVQDGYDTHARQARIHELLLRDLGDSLLAFQRHLAAKGQAKRVTTLVFSEFGRRVAENGSFGTDHGAAGTAFLVGGRVRGGVHGAMPVLADLDDGDLRHHTDFRRVYSTVLARVLGRPAPFAGAFPPLPVL